MILRFFIIFLSVFTNDGIGSDQAELGVKGVAASVVDPDSVSSYFFFGNPDIRISRIVGFGTAKKESDPDLGALKNGMNIKIMHTCKKNAQSYILRFLMNT